VWCFGDDVDTVRALAESGFDWVALDAQHGKFDRRSLIDNGRNLTSAGAAFAVRVAAADAAAIGLALDAGASAVIVPQVDTAGDARLAVAAGKYPPLGSRSWGPLAPLWGRTPAGTDGTQPQLAVMIESAAALANIEEITAVPGVDLVFVGPFDLALSLATTVDALLDGGDGVLERIAAAAHAAGLAAGIFAGTPQRARELRARGYDRAAVSTDIEVIRAGARALLGPH
jgi:2-keto-3-deoxy-L-rhamnonate aldolase RhmA